MHLVRLLRSGYELLTTGVLNVYRPDAEELLAIRNGAWRYEDLVEYAVTMEEKLKAEKNSPLPWGPDWKAIEELQMSLIEKALRNEGSRVAISGSITADDLITYFL